MTALRKKEGTRPASGTGPKVSNALATAASLLFLTVSAGAATFGTVVQMPGHISDIAVDGQRNVVYAANFTANRIEVLSTPTKSLQSSIPVANQPSSVAVSPDGHYLVVGHYALPATPAAAVTIIDLTSRSKIELSLGGESVLAVAFGNAAQALIVSNLGLRSLDPVNGTFTSLLPLCPATPLVCAATTPLTVPWATFPPQILKASAGVSGDGKVIYALIDVPGSSSTIVRYDLASQTGTLAGVVAVPPLGPRVMSVDKTGATFLAGWVLSTPDLVNLAQFPYAAGFLNQGGHAFDSARNLIYAQAPVSVASGASPTAGSPVLHIMDSDNLTVREILQLQENLAGKALISGDTMYAISDSGVTIFPIGALSTLHRVTAAKEDLLFQGAGCDQRVSSQFIDIVDPSGGATSFTLSASSPGVQLSQRSGTTPARVQVVVDSTAFRDQKGTATVLLQIASTQAVNVPSPVRILINTRDPDQQGTLYDVPGTIVDVLADPGRNRFYVLRQDRNQVLVFDGATFSQIATLRTGNTPVQMAISQDQLVVTNDNSQILSVFDLGSLTPAPSIVLPGGYYARSIAVSNRQILATARSTSGNNPGSVLSISLSPAAASVASTGIYTNGIDANSSVVASPSGGSIFLTMPDGTLGLYEAQADTFIASRKDPGPLAGAYASLSDTLFIAGSHIFNSALVRVADIDLLGGVASGATVVNGKGILTTAAAASRSGVLQRFSMDTFSSISPVRTSESSNLAQNLITTPAYQIGQTILPFTRTLALLRNGQSLVQLSTSGFMAIPTVFDVAVAPPTISKITNAADLSERVAPGGLITIWGSGMSSATASAGSLPLPKVLGGVCLYANSISLPMLYVSPTQINAQLPFSLPANASLIISNDTGQSSPFSFNVQATAPAIFRTGNGTATIVRTVDGKLITDQTPIHLNEILNIYVTGMGAVNSPVTEGNASPSNPLASTTVAPTITIGGASIFTLWSGLAPGFAGLYQINAQVPFHHIPTGASIPFTITQGGASTTVNLHVEE